eukprot:8963474-Karenia_brevis.AAC.1
MGSAVAAQAEAVAREGYDFYQYSSAEEAGGSSMSAPPLSPQGGDQHSGEDKRGGRGGRGGGRGRRDRGH